MYIKKIYGHEYYYKSVRENGKVKTIYIKPVERLRKLRKKRLIKIKVENDDEK